MLFSEINITTMKKIGIIGSGAVGVSLAKGFAKHGYEVMIGTNNAEKHEALKEKTEGKTAIGTFAETAAFGDILVLAVKGHVAQQVIETTGAGHFKGKTIIDPTNPIDDSKPPVNGVLHYFSEINDSGMERLQKAYPEANFVKCFNSIGSAHMVNPNFGAEKPTMFICGNNETAKAEVEAILDQFGWEIEDMGGAEAARAIEPLCMLWCIPGIKNGGWNHAFRLLKKQ